MSCIQTLAGIAKDCTGSNKGGIKEVYITNFDNITSKTASNGTITAITMASSAVFYKYAFRPQTASMTSTPQTDSVNGVSYVQTILSLTFAKMDASKRMEMNALSKGDLAVIVLDNNGTYWFLGYDDPVVASGGESGTGTAYGDANKYGIELTDNSNDYPLVVSASIIEGLL